MESIQKIEINFLRLDLYNQSIESFKKSQMKTQHLKLTLIALFATAIAIISFSSCATKVAFLSSPVVPAARGTVKVSKDFNKNYVIKVKISDLAAPDRLTPPKNSYVLWLITADNAAKNIGQINISKSLSADFETVSVYSPSKIIITAEVEGNVLYPSYSDIILTTDYIK